MPDKARLSLVEGTGGNLPATFGDEGTGGQVQGQFTPTGLFHPDGTTYYRGPSGTAPPTPPPTGGSDSGGGGMTPFWKLDIGRDVQFAKWGVASLGGVMLVMLVFLLERIDSRFDRADEKIGKLTEQVSDVRVEIAAQRGDIKSVLEKLDDKPQASTAKR